MSYGPYDTVQKARAAKKRRILEIQGLRKCLSMIDWTQKHRPGLVYRYVSRALRIPAGTAFKQAVAQALAEMDIHQVYCGSRRYYKHSSQLERWRGFKYRFEGGTGRRREDDD